MKKLLILSLVVGLAVITSSLVPTRTAGQRRSVKFRTSPNAVPNRYIVVLKEQTGESFAPQLAVEAEAGYLAAAYGGNVEAVFSSALKGFSVEMSPEQAQILSADERVMYVEEDALISVEASQGSAPWGLDRMDQRGLPLNSTFDYADTGTGVHAYVLDTGIRTTHTEFGGRASLGFDAVNDGQSGDCHGHGTHVAGIIGGATYGVAKNVSLHSVRVMACDGTGRSSQIIAGVDWVTANRILPAVANLSLSASTTIASLDTAINNAINSGVTVVVAAGNNAYDACYYSPAHVPNAITVGNTRSDDARYGTSNYGPCVDLFAPGVGITSASNLDDTSPRGMTGTSMSSPAVAGAAALYLGSNPFATPAQVSTRIKDVATAGAVTNIDSTSPNKLLYSWVNASGPAPTPVPSPSPTATPTPNPTPTPITNFAKVTIKKRARTVSGSAATSVEFPYSATQLAASNFVLANEQTFVDSQVDAFGTQNVISVVEAPVNGWVLSSVDCIDDATGQPSTGNTAIDIANRTANLTMQEGKAITCTFTSDEIAPTAALVSISGRVMNAKGQGVKGVILNLFNANTGLTKSARTNSFGYYSFSELPVTNYYVVTATATRSYTFTNGTRSFTLNDDLSGLDFYASARSTRY